MVSRFIMKKVEGKSFPSEDIKKTQTHYPQNCKHKCEGLFFFLAFPEVIAPEALDGILVTAVVPELKELVARPTTVLCLTLSVGGDIC